MGVLLAGLLLAAVGALTSWLGVGPFGWRYFKHGQSRIFIYNGTPHFALLDIDGNAFEVPPYRGRTYDVVGGDMAIHTRLQRVERNPDSGEFERTDTIDELEVRTFATERQNWLYHIAIPGSTCLAVTDVSALYGGSGGTLEIIRAVFPEARLQPLPYDDVLYPQDILPDKGVPPVIWVAVVNCTVLAEPEKALINLQLEIEAGRRLLELQRQSAATAAPP